MAEFLEAYRKTAVHEGGYANVKGDRGGETYAGIARNSWPNWVGWSIVDQYRLKHNEKVKSKELEGMVKQFYKRYFWDKLQGDAIEGQRIAEFLYDYYVHSGARAIKDIQRIIGVDDDGLFGGKTLAAINATDENDAFRQLFNVRKTFLNRLADTAGQEKFRQGWMNRINAYL